MKYLIGRLRIGAPIGGKLSWDKNLKFFDQLCDQMEKDSVVTIIGNLFDNDMSPTAKDFMIAFRILLKIQEKAEIIICCPAIDDKSYTYTIALILGLRIQNTETTTLYRTGLETKKIGNTYSLACPYYLEGEKRNSKFGYFKGEDTNYEFVENLKSSRVIEMKITQDTDLKELKMITDNKKDDVIKIELDKNLINNINDDDHTDLILILNQDNVNVEKRKDSLDNIESLDDIDFTPDKNFYIKLLISIIKNKEMSDLKRKALMTTLKEIS